MIRFIRVIPTLTAVLVSAGASWAGTISGNVADYNAAEVVQANGVLTVPANIATYTVTSTITTGSSFIVTLPSGFTFGSAPSLTASGGSTFVLASGGLNAQSATFTVATSNLSSGQTILLAGFTVQGANALGTVTPVTSALPLTMQAVGVDASPLSFPAFASAPGGSAVFVGAIQFIDETPPSNATKFLASPDRLTAVISAIVIGPQVADSDPSGALILGPNGMPNRLSAADTATVTIFGNFGGIARVFSSSRADCANSISNGSVNNGSVSIPNVAVGNIETFFCLTGSGAVIASNPNGFTQVTVSPGSSADFVSAPVTNQFPGVICYRGATPGSGGFGCDLSFVPPSPPVATPALSTWALIGLAGMMLLFGAWKLKATPTT